MIFIIPIPHKRREVEDAEIIAHFVVLFLLAISFFALATYSDYKSKAREKAYECAKARYRNDVTALQQCKEEEK